MSPPCWPVEALGVQFVPQIAERVGFAVQIGGDGGRRGGGEIRAVEADWASSARRRSISSARAGASARASSIWRQKLARVGKTSENPSMTWRAMRFLVVISCRSSAWAVRACGH